MFLFDIFRLLKRFGKFFLPKIRQSIFEKKQLKFLEIGLGCEGDLKIHDFEHDLSLWKTFIGAAGDIWLGGMDEKCEKDHTNELKGISLLHGDQADPAVVKQWLKTSGGSFDVIVDDGRHRNLEILSAMETLWTALRYLKQKQIF